ncbi:hypothetical protein [Marivita sp.]|jgi:Ca2+-binding EF-hand superfamily protein|uniref:hypothetical protein n=1 Tax=Marivita sp. TaxID=2003365 RepID=UPI00321BAB2E
MKRFTEVAVVVGVLGTAGYFGYQTAAPLLMQAALQSGGAGNFVEDIAAADANQDGQITRGEATGMIAQAFYTLDSNGNDIIDAEEIHAVMDYVNGGANRPPADDVVARFMTLDTDASGALEKAELDERFHSLIVRADFDGDDAVTPQEIALMLTSAEEPSQ